jgi:hypothetical protein
MHVLDGLAQPLLTQDESTTPVQVEVVTETGSFCSRSPNESTTSVYAFIKDTPVRVIAFCYTEAKAHGKMECGGNTMTEALMLTSLEALP